MDLLFRLACLTSLIVVGAEPRRGALATAHPTLHSADVVLQTSGSTRSMLIQRASGSPYSHVGLVEVDSTGAAFVIEAIAPVTRTPFDRWAARGKGHRVTVLRARALDEATRAAVVKLATTWLGMPYDARYEWDDEKLYCSELVVKAFAQAAHLELGRQQQVKDLHVSADDLKLARSFGISPSQTLVTPGSLDGDAHLEVVARDLAW
jgi:cell wall-associated NlpC family hydrolase